MNAASSLILLFAATIQAQDDSAFKPADRSQHKRILATYTSDAAEYTIYRDASRKDRVEFRREPVLVCSDPVRGGGDGAVFVWTYRGRPEVIGTIFSFPSTGPRKLYHEFHSLSLSVLDVSRRDACFDLDTPGSGHRAGRDHGRAATRPIRRAAAVPDARAGPRFFSLDQGPLGSSLGAAPVAPAPLSL